MRAGISLGKQRPHVVTPLTQCDETVPPQSRRRALTILYDVPTSPPANPPPAPRPRSWLPRHPVPQHAGHLRPGLQCAAPFCSSSVSRGQPPAFYSGFLQKSPSPWGVLCLHSPVRPYLFLLLPWTLTLCSHPCPLKLALRVFS